MIKIRPDQVEELSRLKYRRFEQKAIRHLKKHFPEKMRNQSDDEIQSYVADMVLRAREYGLESEQAIMCFSHLPLLLGDDFESNPKCRFAPVALRAKDVNPVDRAKVAMLMAYQFQARGL